MKTMTYHVYINNEVQGPLTLEQLRDMTSLSENTPVKREGDDGWSDWQTVNAEDALPVAATPPPLPQASKRAAVPSLESAKAMAPFVRRKVLRVTTSYPVLRGIINFLLVALPSVVIIVWAGEANDNTPAWLMAAIIASCALPGAMITLSLMQAILDIADASLRSFERGQ